jgi:hypothetical protein
VRQGDVARVRAQVLQQRTVRARRRLIERQYRALWREQLGELREYEQWMNRP